MLKVLIDSFEIDFDGVIPLRMLNPMFSDEMSHSFNCKTVNTARNKDIINQLHLPEVGYNQVQFPAQIITQGFSFIGAIYINSVTDEYIDFQFNSQNDFWNTASVSLRSINIPFDARYLPVQNSKMMEKFPATGLYCRYMNGLDSNAAAIAGEETLPVPFQKLSTTFEGILNNFKVRIEQNDLKTHRDLDQLYMFNCNSNGKYAYPGISFAFVIFVVTIVDQKFIFDSGGAHNLIDKSYVLVYANIRPRSVQDQLFGRVLQVTVEDETHISFDVDPIVEELDPGLNTMSVRKAYYDGLLSEETKNHLPEIKYGAEFSNW